MYTLKFGDLYAVTVLVSKRMNARTRKTPHNAQTYQNNDDDDDKKNYWNSHTV